MAKYTFITDPGHGWLSVPLSDLQKFNIVQDISVYSYMTKTRAYLEEDCDAIKFIEAAGITPNNPNIRDTYNNGMAKCRSYMPYAASKVASYVSEILQKEVVRHWNSR